MGGAKSRSVAKRGASRGQIIFLSFKSFSPISLGSTPHRPPAPRRATPKSWPGKSQEQQPPASPKDAHQEAGKAAEIGEKGPKR